MAVGPAGGALTSSDGALTVTVPAGALSADVNLTIAPEASPPAGAIGTTYDIGPSGTNFAMPVTIRLEYTPGALGSADPSTLHVATYAMNAWQPLANGTVDTQGHAVSGTTTHLSPYAVISGASLCAQADFGGGGCGGPSCMGGTPPTCASWNPNRICTAYVGATMTQCTDNSAGFQATCCYAPGADICLAALGGGTCALASCDAAQFPGATVVACTENASGWTGACCFPAGRQVCITDSQAGSCNGGGTCSGTPTCSDACTRFPGTTTQQCTTIPSGTGYNAVCCYAPGVVPNDAMQPATPIYLDGGPAGDGGTGCLSSYAVHTIPNGCSAGGQCNGVLYRLVCQTADGGAASCSCIENAMTVSMPSLDCSQLTAQSLVTQCGFPP
jgi:hypothetical protein